MVDVANLNVRFNTTQLRKADDAIKSLITQTARLDKNLTQLRTTTTSLTPVFSRHANAVGKLTTRYGNLSTVLSSRVNRNFQTFGTRLNQVGSRLGMSAAQAQAFGATLGQTSARLMSNAAAAERASGEMAEMGADSLQAAAGVDRLANGLGKATQRQEQFGRGARRTGEQMQKNTGIAARLQAIFASFVTIYTIRVITEYADRWVSLNNFMNAVSDTALVAQDRLQGIADIARSTGGELQTVGTAFNRFIRATENIDVSDDTLLRYIQAFVRSGFLAGATAHELNGAMRQLGQGLQAGALRGDEFNSVAEQAPLLITAIADVLHTTRGELREFAATGGITTEVILQSLELLATRTEREWEEITFTFAQN